MSQITLLLFIDVRITLLSELWTTRTRFLIFSWNEHVTRIRTNTALKSLLINSGSWNSLLISREVVDKCTCEYFQVFTCLEVVLDYCSYEGLLCRTDGRYQGVDVAWSVCCKLFCASIRCRFRYYWFFVYYATAMIHRSNIETGCSGSPSFAS